jgi:hypothetical protein
VFEIEDMKIEVNQIVHISDEKANWAIYQIGGNNRCNECNASAQDWLHSAYIGEPCNMLQVNIVLFFHIIARKIISIGS